MSEIDDLDEFIYWDKPRSLTKPRTVSKNAVNGYRDSAYRNPKWKRQLARNKKLKTEDIEEIAMRSYLGKKNFEMK